MSRKQERERARSRKERSEYVYFEFDKPMKINRLKISGNEIIPMADGIEVKPKRIKYQKSIEKDRLKPKVTLSGEMEKVSINEMSLLDGVEYLIAVDTDSLPYKDKKISVTAIIVLHIYCMETKPDAVEVTYGEIAKATRLFPLHKFCIDTREKNGIISLVKSIRKSRFFNYASAKKILIITDHDLGNLDKYNDKTMPISDGRQNIYLPRKIKLMYASSDKKNDSFFNMIFKECDDISSEELRKVIEDYKKYDDLATSEE